MTALKFVLAVFWLFCGIHTSLCAKILLYTPSVSPSHIVMSGRMADVLVQAGHDVVLFIPEYDGSVTLNGTKLAKVWRMQNISDAYVRGMNEIEDTLFKHATGTAEDRLIFEDVAGAMCEAVMARHQELEVLRNYGFDVVFTEMIDLCGLGIMRFLGIKNHIWHSTTPLHDYVSYNLGVPSPVSYVPTSEENLLGPRMTFWDRAYNFYMYLLTLKIHHYGTDKSTAAIRKYAGADFPSVRQIASESTICFVNSDEFLDMARPILHKTIYIGGIGIGPAKAVEEPYKSILERGQKGVILFSLGTLVPTSTLSRSLKQDIVQLFAQFFDYQFIMKADSSDAEIRELAAKIPNVYITSWMPQSDILGNSRVKLFITHAGFNSILETTIRGVPIIAIPMFADQYRNAKMVEYREYGFVVEKLKLSKSSLGHAISTLLSDGKYAANAKRLSTLVQNKPFKPDEVFVKWTNFVAHMGQLPELTPEGAHMGIVEYFCLDVIAAFLCTVGVAVYLFAVLLRWIISQCCRIGRGKDKRD